MYSDPVEAEYYEKRLKCSLEMAAAAVHAEAVLAHRGLAACYRAKLTSLLRVDGSSVTGARAVLSLAAFRGRKQAVPFQIKRFVGSGGISAGAL
jgi:hypothetical protein